MVYILVKPRRAKNTEKEIRFKFFYKADTGLYLSICFANKIINTIGLEAKDRVSFFYDDENPRKWIIKKSDSSVGFALYKRGGNFSQMIFRWDNNIFDPLNSDYKIKNAIYTVSEGLGGEIIIDGSY